MQRTIFTICFCLFAVLLSGGCSNVFTKKSDGKMIPDVLEKDIESGKTMLIGDYAAVENYKPAAVRGFGLIVGLPGTGSDDANSLAYKIVKDDMSRRGVQNIQGIMASPTTAVVEILGYMRPGCRTGDRFDVQVMLPPETTAKSLRGGKLLTTKLQEMAVLEGQLHEGNTHAFAEGPIMVDDPLATEADNPTGLKKGTVLGGAVAKEPRYLTLVMKSGNESVFMTDRIAKEINHRFFVSSAKNKQMATAKSDSLIVLDVHPSYANDVARYVRVVQAIACYENPAKQIKRIETLKSELTNPNTAQKAAFQLEAIGKNGVAALQEGLKSGSDEIRFHCATSLAYLDDRTPAAILRDIAEKQPAFRVYALNALSVMDNELDAEMSLRELLHTPSAETRYGAFRALKTRNPLDPTIRGELLGAQYQFSYHGIASDQRGVDVPMVHVSMSKQPEIVLFGSNIGLKQPFSLDAGPVIFVNGQTPDTVTVNRFAATGLDEKRTVPNNLDAIIRAVVDLGGSYPDVVQMLRQAEMTKVLSCRLEIDCLPEPNRIYRRQGGNEEPEEIAEEAKPKTFWEKVNPKNLFAPNPGGKTSDFTGTANLSGRE